MLSNISRWLLIKLCCIGAAENHNHLAGKMLIIYNLGKILLYIMFKINYDIFAGKSGWIIRKKNILVCVHTSVWLSPLLSIPIWRRSTAEQHFCQDHNFDNFFLFTITFSWHSFASCHEPCWESLWILRKQQLFWESPFPDTFMHLKNFQIQ